MSRLSFSAKNPIRTHWLFFAVVMPVAVAVRLAYLTRQGFWYDEGASINVANRLFQRGLFLRGEVGSESYLWIAALRLWMVGNSSELWLKMLPAVLSLLAVGAAYVAANRFLGDKKTASFVALMMAVSPFHVYYAHELRSFSLYALIAFCSFYCFARLLDNPRDRLATVGYILTAAAAFYCHYIGLFWIAGLGLAYMFVAPLTRPRAFRWLAVNLCILALCVPGLWCAVLAARLLHKGTSILLAPVWQSPVVTVKNLLVGYTALRTVYVPATVVAVALVLRGVAVLFRTREFRRLVTLVFSAVVPPAVVLALSCITGTSAYLDRYFIPATLPFYIILAVGAMQAHTYPARAKLTISCAVLIGLMAAGLPAVWFDAIHPAVHQRPGVRYKIDNRGAAAYIGSHMRDGDVVAHASHVTTIPFLYYLPNSPGVYVTMTQSDIDGMISGYPMPKAWRDAGVYPQRLQAYLANPDARRLWLVVSWWEPFAREHPPERTLAWCAAHMPLLDHAAFRGIDVYLFDKDVRGTVWRKARLVDGATPVDVYDNIDRQPAVPARIPLSHQGGWWSNSTIYFDPMPTAALDIPSRVVIRPESPGMHTYDYSVYATDLLINAESFLKHLRNSDLWSINIVYNSTPPPPTFSETCLSAAVDKSSRVATDMVSRLLDLEPGRYNLFMRVLLDGKRAATSRAGLAVKIDGKPVAAFDCCVEGVGTGWYWVLLGSVDLTGAGIHRMVMNASNPSNLDKAYLDIDKIAFVKSNKPVEIPRLETPPVIAHGVVSGKPESLLSVDIPDVPSAADELDVFVTDRATGHEFRLFRRMETAAR